MVLPQEFITVYPIGLRRNTRKHENKNKSPIPRPKTPNSNSCSAKTTAIAQPRPLKGETAHSASPMFIENQIASPRRDEKSARQAVPNRAIHKKSAERTQHCPPHSISKRSHRAPFPTLKSTRLPERTHFRKTKPTSPAQTCLNLHKSASRAPFEKSSPLANLAVAASHPRASFVSQSSDS